MSGQQIGTVVGGALGAILAIPTGGMSVAMGMSLGATIGGTIGGIVDPMKINGPHIGDGQAQSATDGTPISWVMGTMWTAGTIVDVGERREVKKTSGGKGGKPKTTTYEAHQDFVILVCESDAIKGSTISNVLAIEQDGKIVYDVRPGSAIVDDSQKYIQNVSFYYGDESQLPPAIVEAIHGVGQNPAYRGVLLACFHDFNLTPAGDRIPSFRFLVSAASNLIPAQSQYRYLQMTSDDHQDYSSPTLDDSAWPIGVAPFAGIGSSLDPSSYLPATAYDQDFLSGVGTAWPVSTVLWLRHEMYLSQTYSTLQLKTFMDDHMDVYINGTKVLSTTSANGGHGTIYTIAASALVIGRNVIALKAMDEFDGGVGPDSLVYFDMKVYNTVAETGSVPLSNVCSRVCLRGGLGSADVDTSALAAKQVAGYSIAKQCTAVDAMSPLLGAYFAYGAEYDGKLNFSFAGADAVLTIDEDDIVDTGNDPVSEATRGNATEYPRRVIGAYYDPDQNYLTATVMATRRASGVKASGDLSFQIPVVMSANEAQQAVDKAMKVAYARLDGTQNVTLPFATASNCYLRLVSGDAVIYQGRRWVVAEETIGAGTITLALQADRQSAYTSDVQAIPGRVPTAPQSLYSGPTKIIPMSLPKLQSQDPFGVYVVTYSDPHNSSWRSAAIQMSLDSGATWQDVGTSNVDGNIGVLTAADGGTTITAQFTGDLSSVGTPQLDAGQNAAVLIHGTSMEVLQFGTATEDRTTDNLYVLTDLRRDQADTGQVTGAIGDKIVLLDAAQVIPIDTGFASQTIQFRAVGGGENSDDAAVASVVYSPDTTTIISGGTPGDGLT